LYRAIRLSFLNGKYRESIDFSFSKLDANIKTIKNIDTTLRNILYAQENSKSKDFRVGVSIEFREYMQEVI
jgi:cysteinyl-tRNA synthetase